MNTEFNVICTYSTAEAVEDGTLIRVPEATTTEAGIKIPVFLTRAVYVKYIEVEPQLKGEQDEEGRLWDILTMFRHYAAQHPKSQEIDFQFIIRLRDADNWEKNERRFKSRQYRTVTLTAQVRATDFNDPRPAVFIMKPGED